MVTRVLVGASAMVGLAIPAMAEVDLNPFVCLDNAGAATAGFVSSGPGRSSLLMQAPYPDVSFPGAILDQTPDGAFRKLKFEGKGEFSGSAGKGLFLEFHFVKQNGDEYSKTLLASAGVGRGARPGGWTQFNFDKKNFSDVDQRDKLDKIVFYVRNTGPSPSTMDVYIDKVQLNNVDAVEHTDKVACPYN